MVLAAASLRQAGGLDAGEHAADGASHDGGEIIGDAAVIDVFAYGIIEDPAMHDPDMLDLGLADRHVAGGGQPAAVPDFDADRPQDAILDDPDVAPVDIVAEQRRVHIEADPLIAVGGGGILLIEIEQA